MSWAICSYQDCLMQRLPFSTIAFFRLPQIEPRRSQWIKNSGNKCLRQLTQTQTRYICEKHFRAEDIRHQFNRKLLRKEAVPVSYDTSIEHYVLSEEEQLEDTENENNVAQITSTVNNNEQEKLWLNHSNHSNGSSELLEIELQAEQSINSMQEFAHTDSNEIDESFENEVFAIISQEETDFIEHESESNVEMNEAQVVPAKIIENGAVNVATSSTVATAINNRTVTPSNLSKANNDNREQQQLLHDESYASDRHFALSLVYHFQRLNARKKARAKIKILTYLTALELEDDDAELN